MGLQGGGGGEGAGRDGFVVGISCRSERAGGGWYVTICGDGVVRSQLLLKVIWG